MIIERAIDMDPKAAGSLSRVGKVGLPMFASSGDGSADLQSFSYLLKTYQNSILKYALQGDSELKFVNSTQYRIHATSIMTPGKFTVDEKTYPWLSEIRFRTETINFLVQHGLTDMTDPMNHWPVLENSKGDLEKRLLAFKKDGLHLLYRLSDCAAGLKTRELIRCRQAQFLQKEMSVFDLAALGVIVEVMGQGFFNMTHAALRASGLLNVSVSMPQKNGNLC